MQSSPEEGNPPSQSHLSSLNKHVWRGYTAISILESGSLLLSIGLCKSVKYAKKHDNKWVFYTESSIPLQIVHHSCNCTWLISVRIWSMQHLYGTPTNRDLSTLWRECRSLHLRCAPKTGVPNTSLCFKHATCPPLPAEDTT